MEFIKQDWKNPTFGIQNTGPAFNLPAGHYDLKFSVKTDGAGEIRIVSKNDAPIEPASFPFSSDQDEQIVSFDILASAKLVDIVVDWQSGTYYEMGETRLYTPYYRDNAFTLLFFSLSLWILFAMNRRGWLSSDRKCAIILLSFAVLFASAPALREHLSVFHDTRYHSARLRNLADALALGQFPARLGGFSYNGYGAITSVFYPDFLLMPFALLLFAGASLQYVMNLLLIAGNLLAAFTMYWAGIRIWKEERAALLSAIIYTLAVYHITDGSVRYALGELFAMGFLPLFLAGLIEVLHGDKKQWPLLSFGAALIFMSHLLSTFLTALMAAAFVTLNLPQILREKRIVALIKALGLTVLVCSFQILPILTYARLGIGPGDSMFSTTMESTAIAPAQLFLRGEGNLAKVPKDATISFIPLELGLPLVLGVALFLVFQTGSINRKEPQGALANRFLLVGGWFCFMATTLFPWAYVSAVTDLFDRVQFAYRYLMFPTLLFSLVSGLAFSRISQAENSSILVTLFVLAICVSSILPTTSAQTRLNTVYEFGTDVSPDIRQFDEYCLPGADMKVTDTRSIETSDGVTISNVLRKSVHFDFYVHAPEGGTIDLPVFAFDGYKAEIDGKEIALAQSVSGKLRIILPVGTAGDLRVRFIGKPVWRIANAVSLLTILISIVIALRKRNGRKITA